MASTSIPAVRRGSSLVQMLQRPTSVLAAGHLLAMPRWQHLEIKLPNAMDGRNSAPVGRWENSNCNPNMIPVFRGYQLVQDFVHPQYHIAG